ncbi:hypothetical protein ABTX35_19355 [Streptomyces sp. NPDC096080]|uniref:hypothetical protein n=1 Tax=Streptomyces sp. NPDC096080 TaxID=3156693 RepID=UPI0033244211
MDQATQPTTPTAPPPADSYQHASDVAASIMADLVAHPFAVEIENDFPTGWRAHFKYRGSRGAGLYEFAALVDVPVTRADTESGNYLEAITRVKGIEIQGSALVTAEEAARLAGEPAPLPADPPTPTAPLGSSITAYVPAIATVPAPAATADVSDGDA